MSSRFHPLEPAEPVLDGSGTPYSPRYGDVYHTRWGALRQAESVFLRGNGLPDRWRGRPAFTVLETGFGLGMNFLALWQAWRDDPARSRRLHVVSLEAHPLRAADLAALHRQLVPEALRPLSDALLRGWPPLLPGLHRLDFEGGALTLTLGFGLAQELAGRLCLRADAFFLDGFAPDRNPDMWRPELLADLAGLAAPGATAATWSSAGAVRRGLQAAGFAARREAGQGGKQHITVAEFVGRPAEGGADRAGAGRASRLAIADVATVSPSSVDAGDGKAGATAGVHPGRRPWPGWTPAVVSERHALVVGGGPAGAGIAHALALRGWSVTVIDPAFAAGPAGLHEGHAAAALTPVIARGDNARARLSRAGSARALARWAGLPGEPALRCGTLHLARDAARAAEAADTLRALGFPSEWAEPADAAQASARAGLALDRGGVFFADGMLVRPPQLLAGLLAAPGVARIAAAVGRLEPAPGGGWRALGTDGAELARAPVAVVANAAAACALASAAVRGCGDRNHGAGGDHGGCPGSHDSDHGDHGDCAHGGRHDQDSPALPALAAMHALAGQITLLPAAALGGGPRCVVAGDGYLLPGTEGWCVAGSTYEHDAAEPRVSDDGRRANLAKAARLCPPADGLDPAGLPGWAGWRAVLPGRLPAIGPMPGAPGLWLACGYASRGLTWSALGGEIVGAALEGEPLPLERDLLAAIAPR